MNRHVSIVRAGVAWWGSVAALLLAVAAAHADFPKPKPTDSLITIRVGQLLEHGHLSKQPIDDEMSKVFFDTLLRQFDRNKMYFTAADVEEFSKYKTLLDDYMQNGDLSFAYLMARRYLERLEQRTALVMELLKGPFDFDRDETMVADPETLSYPATDEEVHERWRKRVKYELLVRKIKGDDDAKAIDWVSRQYRNNLRILRQIDSDEILEWYLGALARSYDPHTDYMSRSSLEEFNIHMRLQLEGIGAELRAEDEYTIVVRSLPGGAAAEDGRLKAGDKIVGVGQGEDGEIEPVVGMKLRNVVKLIRGKPGSVVRLEVETAEGGSHKVYQLTRRTVEIKDYGARSETVEHGKKADGAPYRIGVIGLDSFYVDSEAAARGDRDYTSTTRDVRRILGEFKQKGVDVVVLDLRANGGGYLTEAISLTGLFIDQGPVVQVKSFDDRVQPYRDQDAGLDWSGPLVVLVSKNSASAAEIFAAAIQDYGRGLIVGDATTHGKGTVQNLLDLAEQADQLRRAPGQLGALKLTMQKFYRVNGDSTQQRGVHSDVVLPSLLDHADVGESTLPHAMKFDQVPPTEHGYFRFVVGADGKLQFREVDPQGRADFGAVSRSLAVTRRALTGQLQALSESRQHNNEKFVKLEQRIDRFVARKNRKEIPLQEAKLRAELKAGDEDEANDADEEKLPEGPPPVFDLDSFYNQEVLSITEDYLRLSRELGLGAVSRKAN